MDWALVTEYYAKDFRNRGGKIFLDFPVTDFSEARESQGGEFPIKVSEPKRVIIDLQLFFYLFFSIPLSLESLDYLTCFFDFSMSRPAMF